MIRKAIRLYIFFFYKVQPADSEKSLILLHYSKNTSTEALWAIFEINKDGRPNTLNYKIRSSKIAKSELIMIHDEEPSYKGEIVICLNKISLIK